MRSLAFAVCFLGIITLTICDAKPSFKKRFHSNQRVFHEEEPLIPAVPPVKDLPPQDKYQWMAWNSGPTHKNSYDSAHSDNLVPINELPVSEVHEESKEKVEEKEKIDFPVFKDPCTNVYCHYGRICEKTAEGVGECVCAGEDFCEGHDKKVCGTDGVAYPSHCELHRMACVKDMHIGIDHSGTKCTDDINKEQVEPLDESILSTDEKIVKKDEEPEAVEPIPTTPKPETEYPSNLFEVKCTDLEYERLKNNLMDYHCARIGEKECHTDDNKKRFVANIMFNYYDRNSNQILDIDELKDIEHRDHLEKLSRFCSLTDMLNFDDKEEDDGISLTEFFTAFRIPTVVLDENLKVFTTLVTVGNSIEMKCDIRGSDNIIWKRNGALLDEITTDDIKQFEDGSLYINDLGLHHMGNYTCQDRFNDRIVQTHILKVQMVPKVHVSPSTQFHTSGSSVTLKCHADGVPEPNIIWEMNESPLAYTPEDSHYYLKHNNATLEIKTATYTKDTGAYKCKAKNSAGTAQDIATVFIESSKLPKYSDDELYEVFVVFHDKGFTIYEPNHCHIEHQVSGSFSSFKILPEYGDVVKTLCEPGKPCSWGQAVNVRNKFLYITQPELNRVVVIEIRDRSNPVEIIHTDKVPVRIQYVEHQDQVWVLCWNEEEDAGSKTAVIIRQASDDQKHQIVHTQPVGNVFDLIQDIFLPPNNDLKHKFTYGYVTHKDQQGLYKLDLETMKYVKHIDLKDPYKCVPTSIAFIPMGGQIAVHCTAPPGDSPSSSRLIIDYVTDAVLQQIHLGGDLYVSPDARYLVVVEDDGNTISVNKILDDGKLEHVFDEYTNAHISDITFFPSERGRGYDFYASSANKNDVIYINLTSGKVEMIEGVGQAMKSSEWRWSKHNRVIVSGGIFGEYLMTPSKDSVVVIDGKRRHVQCEWQNIEHGNVIVWVEPMHL